MDWVKDKTRLEEEASFPDGTTRQELIYELEESTTKKKCIKEQNKVEESLITTSFQVQLEAAGQWDRWMVDLESNLKNDCRSKRHSLVLRNQGERHTL